MTKISEAIKYYESINPKTDFDSYFGDSYASLKIQTLSLMQKALGDVDLTDDCLKAFIYGFKSFPFKTPYDEMIQKVRIIYELSKDTKMKIEELLTLIELYQIGAYSLMDEEIKKLISTHKDFKTELKLIISEAIKYGILESKKLDYLKEEYSKSFVERLEKDVKDKCISSSKVLEIIPSKEFIDASKVSVPKLGYTIISAEELVLKRLERLEIEDGYQKTLPDEKIVLGLTSYGDKVYTSFTKYEYEEDLKSKKLIRKK